ncbi:MAG: hypothetical protein ACO1N6_04530 [Microcella sp.]
MESGLAEISLIATAGLAGVALISGIIRALVARERPTAAKQARSRSAVRDVASALAGLLAFAVAVAVHIANPEWQGVPFLVAPLVAATAALTVFATLPPPTIDGAVRVRHAELTPRHIGLFSSGRQRMITSLLFGVTVTAVITAGLTSGDASDGRSLCFAFYDLPCTPGGSYLYPGWMFAVPALALTATLFAATFFAVRRVVSSPAAAWPELAHEDGTQREGAVRLVLQTASVALVLTLGFFLGAAGIPLLNAEILETGLSARDDSIARSVGLVLVGSGSIAVLSGGVLAITTLAALSGRRRNGSARQKHPWLT